MTRIRLEGATRPAAVAGMFYAADPAELQATVDQLLADAGKSCLEGSHARTYNVMSFANDVSETDTATPKALIAPHAGYIYSGRVAGAAYRLLANARGKITRVVLLGPSHRFAFNGMATTVARGFETPLGIVPVDHQWLDRVRDHPLIRVSDEAHAAEHCLETQLPFLQRVLGDFTIAPIICGRVSSEEVADVLDKLWGGAETIIVVSSDLSHYLDYQACRAMDASTCAVIERLNPVELTPEQACGATPVNGLLAAARRRRLRVETLDLRNSGDTAGPRDRVVGYGAWAFWEQDTALQLSDEMVRRHGALMNDVARQAITGGGSPPGNMPAAFKRAGACFVTLHKAGLLRGCSGSVMAWRTLIEDIRANALRAAFNDPRFFPLEQVEWDEISLSVTLLSPLQSMRFESEAELLSKLLPHRDGLLIEDAGHRALFLPAVWKTAPDKQEFLMHLKAKAGLPPDHWSSTFRANRFTTTHTVEEGLRLVQSTGELAFAT